MGQGIIFEKSLVWLFLSIIGIDSDDKIYV